MSIINVIQKLQPVNLHSITLGVQILLGWSMSCIKCPIRWTGADTALHVVVAGVVLVATIAAACYGFWRIHELPINKAHSKEHHQPV